MNIIVILVIIILIILFVAIFWKLFKLKGSGLFEDLRDVHDPTFIINGNLKNQIHVAVAQQPLNNIVNLDQRVLLDDQQLNYSGMAVNTYLVITDDENGEHIMKSIYIQGNALKYLRTCLINDRYRIDIIFNQDDYDDLYDYDNVMKVKKIPASHEHSPMFVVVDNDMKRIYSLNGTMIYYGANNQFLKR